MRSFTLPITAAVLAMSAQAGSVSAAETHATSAGDVRVERMAAGLDSPWGFAFLPDGGVLVTEKTGALRLWRDGVLSGPISGAPDVNADRQGGLLDVALARDFDATGEIYLSFSSPAGFFDNQTAVARATLADAASAPRLENVEVIFRQEPPQRTSHHYGSRIVVADDGSLFVTVGDRGQREEAQNPASHQGSVIRITRDGAAHPDNPFIGNQRGWAPEIHSFGHRNPQGATMAPDGTLWTVEHGAKGGDEINRPVAGANHGWPLISYGTHYNGARIGAGSSAPGMTQPIHHWDPSIAPSGLEWYEGDMFPEWRGDLLVGALKYQMLVRLDMEAGQVIGEERMFSGAYGRIRDVREAPDGAIWFATDGRDGGLFRVSRAD